MRPCKRNSISTFAGICALILLAILAVPSLTAQTFQVIHTFTGGADGGRPQVHLAMKGNTSTASPPATALGARATWDAARFSS